MNFAFVSSRSGSAGEAGAPCLPGFDYEAYRRKAARLCTQAYRQAALALRDATVGAGRAVIAFTDAIRGTCDTDAAPGRKTAKTQPSLAIHMPQLPRANDNVVIARQSESA